MWHLRWVMWPGEEGGHSHTKVPPPPGLQDQRHFVVMGSQEHPPPPFLCTWGWRGGKCTDQTTSRQQGHSHRRHLCHILPRPWCALRHSDRWLREPSGWLGAPGDSKHKLIFGPTSSPETYRLLNCDFQAKSSNFPQLKSGKGYETTWVRKPKVIFAILHGALEGQHHNSRCAAAG